MPELAEVCSEPTPLLQQGTEDEVCNAAGAAASSTVEALARSRRGVSVVNLAVAGLAVGALLLCCSYVVPRMPDSSVGLLHQPELDDVGGITGLEADLQDVSEFVEPIRMALSGEPKPAPGEPQRYLVFRCRGRDYAGGFGDRLAGLFGAAYLAMSMRRQLKVDWPELNEAFLQNLVDLSYDPNALGIQPGDQQILNAHQFGDVPNFPDGSFAGLSQDVVVFNAWDVNVWYSDHWRKFPSDVSNRGQNYRVIIMSGNRAGTQEWFGTLQNMNIVPQGVSFWGLYHVLFGTMLKPNPAFMKKEISIQVASVMRPSYNVNVPMSKAFQVLDDVDTFSMGVHIRAGDEVIQGEANFDLDNGAMCEGVETATDYMPRLGCIVNVAKQHAAVTAKKKVLVVFSDSRCVKKHIMDYFTDSAAFTEVWSQELSGTVNIDTTLQADKEDEKHAWEQTMRDWMLMQHVDIFAITTSYTFLSGFPASALVTTSVDKERYSLQTCTPMPETAICADRFC